jgi:hypothetical protein
MPSRPAITAIGVPAFARTRSPNGSRSQRAARSTTYRRFGDRKTYVDLDEAKQVLDWREE